MYKFFIFNYKIVYKYMQLFCSYKIYNYKIYVIIKYINNKIIYTYHKFFSEAKICQDYKEIKITKIMMQNLKNRMQKESLKF